MKPKIICFGSGLAGINFALHASRFADVTIFCKDRFYNSNSYLAKGGIAIALADDDSVEQHIKDTITAGAGLCDEKTVRFVVENAKQVFNHLLELNIDFTRNGSAIDLGREGGHSRNRIIHIKDETGKHLMKQLYVSVKNNPYIHIVENAFLADLQVEDGLCRGAWVLHSNNNKIQLYEADAIVLATGGCGQLYLHNTNSKSANGDGYAAAYRAGTQLQNMEFMQFHPTLLYEEKSEDPFLITEAFRGAGAKLVNNDGVDFMKTIHPMGSLAPRDIVSLGIYEEMRKSHTNHVYLYTNGIALDKIRKDFPALYETCKQRNIDVRRIPVLPAAHYMCGGVKTNLKGETNIKNLFAIGEVACTGFHGANRLASNSLLEALVFSEALAKHLGSMRTDAAIHLKDTMNAAKNTKAKLPFSKHDIQKLMWDNFGICRNMKNMKTANETLSLWQKESEFLSDELSLENLELRNMAQVAGLIAQFAIARKESVGCHFVVY